MEHKVALCIPTYEREEIVRDFLSKCSLYYFEAGIDIYYYDSSVSDRTQKLVEGWPEKEHLFYIRFPSEVEADEKAGLIYQCYGLKYDYDFIWLSNDSYQIMPNAIRTIITNLLPEYDIVNITPEKQDYDHCGLRVFDNPEDYIWSSLYNIGRFGNAIVNRKTMLDGIDWGHYMDLFLSEDTHAIGNFLFYFFRLAELDHMKALYMPIYGSDLRDSAIKMASNWREKQFEVWCDIWVKGIEKLPDVYKNKSGIIYKFTSSMCIHDWRDFKNYRVDGVYNYEIFKQYKSVWHRLTPTSLPCLFFLSIMPRKLPVLPLLIKRAFRRKKFNRFIKRYSKKYIYGTSTGGIRYAMYLDEIGCEYEGFCCTKRLAGEKELMGHKIYEFEEIKNDLDDVGFIIAMQDENYAVVRPILERHSCNCYRNGAFEGDFCYEMGCRGASWYIGKIR